MEKIKKMKKKEELKKDSADSSSPLLRKRRSMLNDPTDPNWGIGTGNWCPDCGGLCGNDKHNRRW